MDTECLKTPRVFSISVIQMLVFLLLIRSVEVILIASYEFVSGDTREFLDIRVALIVQLASYLSAIYVYFYRRGHRFEFKTRDWVSLHQIYWMAISLSAVIAIAVTPIVDLLPKSEQIVGAFEELSKTPGLFIFSTIVFAPVFEELIFRGIILRGFLSRYPKEFSLMISSLAFGAFHANWQQFVVATIVGFVSGWIYIETKSVLYSIIFHATYNFSITFVIGIITEFAVQPFTQIIAVVIAFGIFKVAYDRFQKDIKVSNHSDIEDNRM